jgi:HPt (histidine-containing phosphotransfer) domain-containing protein
VLDRSVHAELAALIGAEALAGLTGQLVDDLAGRFIGAGDGPEVRARHAADAHAVVSTAGLLGFTALARLCTAFEDAYRAGEPLEARLQEVRRATAAVLAEVEDLRRAA